jgi:ABC-type uncharacterized transport system substrate-binding protein
MFAWRVVVAVLIVLPILSCPGFAATTGAEDADETWGRPKRILWVDSYDEGYEWSQGIEKGLRQALAGTGVKLDIWRMDTRRHKEKTFARQAGISARDHIERVRPDLVIASDDNAQQYLVVPFLKDTALPVVFCGVSEDPAGYGYPASNVTGMVEVDQVDELFRQLRRFARGDRIGVLFGAHGPARTFARWNNERLFQNRMKVYEVHTMAEFKQAVLAARQEVDMLHLRNYVGIEDWDAAEAEAFLLAHAGIPTGAVNSWMKNLVLFTLAKLPEEQGEYAALAALRILYGARPGDIPLVSNRLARLTVNLRMARAAGIVLPVSLLRTADIIGREAYDDNAAAESQSEPAHFDAPAQNRKSEGKRLHP